MFIELLQVNGAKMTVNTDKITSFWAGSDGTSYIQLHDGTSPGCKISYEELKALLNKGHSHESKTP